MTRGMTDPVALFGVTKGLPGGFFVQWLSSPDEDASSRFPCGDPYYQTSPTSLLGLHGHPGIPEKGG